MNSPRLSTDGAGSAIERAFLFIADEANGYEFQGGTGLAADLRALVAAARAELAELRAQPEPLKPEQEQALQALADEGQAMGLYDKPEQGREVELRCGDVMNCGLRWTDKTGDDRCPNCGGTSVRELEPRR